jgi:hypothetical protein
MLTLSLLKPHTGQQQVLDARKRFNVLCMGRRFGKTTLKDVLIAEKALYGKPVAYHAPTYKMLDHAWESTKQCFSPIIATKDETLHEIRLKTGGVIDFWSAENPDASRGRPYARVIMDEVASIPSDRMKYLYRQVIRPGLADYIGDFYALSTPNGRAHYFYEMFGWGGTKDGWAAFQMPTSTNPYILASEIADAKAELDPISFEQEFLAQFVDFTSRPFAYAFEASRHAVECQDNPQLPLWLSFDFNVDPMTCIVGQHQLGDFVHIFDEMRLKDSNIVEMCDRIKAKYPNRVYIATGDATGQGRSGHTRENLSYWQLIKRHLYLNTSQMLVPSVNPHVDNTRVTLNSLLHNHPNFKINPATCPYLVQDLKYVEVDQAGNIDKSANKYRSHLLDCLRYYCYTNLNKFVKLF